MAAGSIERTASARAWMKGFELLVNTTLEANVTIFSDHSPIGGFEETLRLTHYTPSLAESH
jgi:hypothetical protein